jgi:hypothetical protein
VFNSPGRIDNVESSVALLKPFFYERQHDSIFFVARIEERANVMFEDLRWPD